MSDFDIFPISNNILNVKINYAFNWQHTMSVPFRILIVLFVVFLVSLALLSIAKAGKFRLTVKDTEINPAVAVI